MVERELTSADLADDLLLDLIGNDDPIGVLSIYVDAAYGAADGAVTIDIRNRLAELERRVEADEGPGLAAALRRSLRLIAPAIERIPDPRGSGRGRALFVALSTGEVTTFASRLRVPNRVVLDATPFVHPLLELIDEGRPAGVILVSGRSADLLDWRLGDLRRVALVRADAPALRGERPGPLVANAGRGHQITPTREVQARRQREHQHHLLEQVAAECFRLGEERGWERLLIAGDRRLTSAVADVLPTQLRRSVLFDSRHLTEIDGPVLAIAVAERLGHDRAERHHALAKRARDAALGFGSGALGLADVLHALNDARVEHLLYDPNVRYTGALDSDYRLHAVTDAHNAIAQEPRLTERMVERCLRTAARVTPLETGAADSLADANGIAALLRW